MPPPPSRYLVQKDALVFENSPKQTLADVRHELVPESDVASKILTQPETMVKIQQVSSRLKTQDAKWRDKRPSLPTAYTTPRSSVVSSPLASEIIIDVTPAAGFKRKQELWEGRSPNCSPLQQRLRRDTETVPFLRSSLVLGQYESTETQTAPAQNSERQLSLLWRIKKFLCCDYSD